MLNNAAQKQQAAPVAGSRVPLREYRVCLLPVHRIEQAVDRAGKG